MPGQHRSGPTLELMGTLTTSLKRRIRGVMVWTAVGCGMIPNLGFAQSQPAYVLEWQTHDAPATKPPGNDYLWNSNTNSPVYTPTARASAIPQTLDESGADWWHSVIPITQGGSPAGYVAVGYTSFVNWGVSDGCYSYALATYPSTVFNQRYDRMRGAIRNAVAKYDLDGNLIWYKYYFMESLFDVIQDSNEDLVVTGEAGNSVPLADMNTSIPLFHNPSSSNPSQALQTTGCTTVARHCLVMKLDLSGNVLWHSVYTPLPGSATLAQIMALRGSGQSIAETTFASGAGYRIVGFGNTSTPPEDVFMLDVDMNGQVLATQILTTFPTAVSANSTAGFSRGLHIAHTTIGGVEHYAMSGFRKTAAAPTLMDAFLWVFTDASTLFFKDTRQNASEVGCNTSLEHLSSSSCFTNTSSPQVVWSVLSDHTTDGSTPGNPFAGRNHQAIGKLISYDLSGTPTWAAPLDLGVSRGLELQSVVSGETRESLLSISGGLDG